MALEVIKIKCAVLKRMGVRNHRWGLASSRQATVEVTHCIAGAAPGLQKLILWNIRQNRHMTTAEREISSPALNRRKGLKWVPRIRDQQVCKEDLSLIPHLRGVAGQRDGREKLEEPAEFWPLWPGTRPCSQHSQYLLRQELGGLDCNSGVWTVSGLFDTAHSFLIAPSTFFLETLLFSSLISIPTNL